MGALHTLDCLVPAVYFAIVIAVCVRVSRRSPDSDELFLAGRTLGAGVVGLSLFASNLSSTTLIGLPGAAWSSGIAVVANYEWMAALVLLFTAWFVATQLGWLHLHFSIVAGLLFVITLVLAWAWQAALGGRPDATRLASVDQSALPALPRALRVAAIGVTLATLGMVLAFW